MEEKKAQKADQPLPRVQDELKNMSKNHEKIPILQSVRRTSKEQTIPKQRDGPGCPGVDCKVQVQRVLIVCNVKHMSQRDTLRTFIPTIVLGLSLKWINRRRNHYCLVVNSKMKQTLFIFTLLMEAHVSACIDSPPKKEYQPFEHYSYEH